MANILLIDDDELVRRSIRAILEAKGYAVDIAENGMLVMEKLRARSVDLVITDIFMPGKDGLEITAEIRREFPLIKILALSGGGIVDSESVLESALDVGADRCHPKPISSVALIAITKELLEET